MSELCAIEERVPLVATAAPVDRLPVYRRAAFSVGHVLNDVCVALWFSYTLLYLQEVLGMAPILAGVLLMVGQVTEALSSPVIGVLCNKFGTTKMWHLAGTGLVTLSFPLIFATPSNCNINFASVDNNTSLVFVDNNTNSVFVDNGTNPLVVPTLSPANDWPLFLYFLVVIVAFQIGFAAVQISHLSLIPALSRSQLGRDELTAIRNTAAVSAAAAVFVISWAVFHSTRQEGMPNAIGPCDGYKFREIVLIGLAVGVPCSVLFHLGLEKPKRHAVRVLSSNNHQHKVQRTIGSYFRSPLLLQLALMYVASRVCVNVNLAYMPLFLDKELDEEAEVLAIVPLVMFVSSFFASIGIKYFNSRFGSKVGYLLGGVLSLAGCIWIATGSGHDFAARGIYGVPVFIGAGTAITSVASLCLTADLIGTETETGSFAYSVVIFADKMCTGLSLVIIEYIKCPRSEMCPHFYRHVLTSVCGGWTLLGLAMLATLAQGLGTKAVDPAPSTPSGDGSLNKESPGDQARRH